MTQTGYIILAVSILVGLLIIFIVSFVLYRKTPLPKGCEEMKMSEEKCTSCPNNSCAFHKKEEDKE